MAWYENTFGDWALPSPNSDNVAIAKAINSMALPWHQPSSTNVMCVHHYHMHIIVKAFITIWR
jgi:hypothetical protein